MDSHSQWLRKVYLKNTMNNNNEMLKEKILQMIWDGFAALC